MAHPLVAGTELRLAGGELTLGTEAPRTEHKQVGDESALDQDDRSGRKDVWLIARPDAGVAKANHRCRGNTRLADLPALDLPPVDFLDLQLQPREWNPVGALATKDPEREAADGLHFCRLAF